jgi:sugar phosphate isomerase/epimerase
MKISLQLYSLRDACQSDLLGTIQRVGDMGYDGVEFAGFFGHSAEDIRKTLDAAGLVCSGTHVGLLGLSDDDFKASMEFHQAIGAPYPIVPWTPSEKRANAEVGLATAHEFTELADKVAAYGMKTGYHVHDGDVKPLDGGKSFWQIVGENTPAHFLMQWDTCNGISGGADAVQAILDYPGRGASIHAKEYTPGKVIGDGEVPWDKVMDACRNVAGTEWLVVEHETYIDMTPFEAVERCLAGLRAALKAS